MKKEELIEKYIQDSLSKEEKAEFDKRIDQDPGFEKEVAFHTDLKTVIANEDCAEFRSLIEDYEARGPSVFTKKFPSINWLVAASVVVIFGLFYFFNYSGSQSTDQLFEAYFEPYRNIIVPIERRSNKQDEKTRAFALYENGEYLKATELFSDLYKDSNEPYYLFYEANALLKLDKADKAIPLLLDHLDSNDSLAGNAVVSGPGVFETGRQRKCNKIIRGFDRSRPTQYG